MNKGLKQIPPTPPLLKEGILWGVRPFGGTEANAEEGDYWQNWRSEATGSATKMWVSYSCRDLSPLWKRGAGGFVIKARGYLFSLKSSPTPLCSRGAKNCSTHKFVPG